MKVAHIINLKKEPFKVGNIEIVRQARRFEDSSYLKDDTVREETKTKENQPNESLERSLTSLYKE